MRQPDNNGLYIIYCLGRGRGLLGRGHMLLIFERKVDQFVQESQRKDSVSVFLQ